MAWHDNEWGFSNRMLDNAQALIAAETTRAKSPSHNPGGYDSVGIIPEQAAFVTA